MNYQETVNWMFKQLPMYQNLGTSAYKKDLSNTLLLAAELNHPENHFKSIHVAGTNGKGSTSHMLASILQEAGYKVGLYTSPHLKDFRERIKINGEDISEDFVVDFIDKHLDFFQNNHLSFFEMTVGMAFDYFAKSKVDIAIIEVGLGGRLDSTNIITPLVSVITNIGLDHTQFLGNDLVSIAKEKAGIIKRNVPVVIGETQEETEAVFKDKAGEEGAEIHFADQEIGSVYESDLKGLYQQKNIKTVLQAIQLLRKDEFIISDEAVQSGLKKVSANTGLKGRWQILEENPKIVCDTAHNKEGLKYIVEQLSKENYQQLHIVFGVVNDKSLEPIFELMPKNATYYFCKPDMPRGLDADVLKDEFLNHGFVGEVYSSVNEGLKTAREHAGKSDFIYVGGSTFVVAEII
ncbi:folylpolyglutamate synthase/dihydrofolate synthase family protein [Mangrovimonas sp. YM274]|uniref:bifunctional folylpolyglutamate synthase/dihydrofolate synthase n=1 Tax=Mangrovimonas sp. YM274 TaxID=3070660 RepID=UPI0027DEA1BE|nr:folylpolyglutamate synthase/dihydrofolate synthase family protein [Mangrovimonas sp. YM274]WMI69649.1 folylpolyglutamate synthase/dihydrofolate synthase family protein [Mangrovimonas sp. YM274]